MFTTSDVTILLHELGGDNGGGEWSGVGRGLEEDNNNGLPGGVLGKQHEHDLSEELVVECFLVKLTILHGEEVEMSMHILTISVLLLQNPNLCVEHAQACVSVLVLKNQLLPNLLHCGELVNPFEL